MSTRTIGQTRWNGKTFYVSHLPGPVGDFGFTQKINGTPGFVPGDREWEWRNLDCAINLSPYWQARFAKRCRDLGDPVQFLTVPSLNKAEAAA